MGQFKNELQEFTSFEFTYHSDFSIQTNRETMSSKELCCNSCTLILRSQFAAAKTVCVFQIVETVWKFDEQAECYGTTSLGFGHECTEAVALKSHVCLMFK